MRTLSASLLALLLATACGGGTEDSPAPPATDDPGARTVHAGPPPPGTRHKPGGRVAEARPVAADLPNFLLIDIDTMRADRVGHTRGGQSITPILDALAAQGATFSQAYSQSAWTMPAVFSLLTGRYPLLQEVRGDTLPWWGDQVRSVADVASYYGYRTGIWWGATLLAGDPAFSRGFADRSEPFPPDSDAAAAYDVPLASWI